MLSCFGFIIFTTLCGKWREAVRAYSYSTVANMAQKGCKGSIPMVPLAQIKIKSHRGWQEIFWFLKMLLHKRLAEKILVFENVIVIVICYRDQSRCKIFGF